MAIDLIGMVRAEEEEAASAPRPRLDLRSMVAAEEAEQQKLAGPLGAIYGDPALAEPVGYETGISQSPDTSTMDALKGANAGIVRAFPGPAPRIAQRYIGAAPVDTALAPDDPLYSTTAGRVIGGITRTLPEAIVGGVAGSVVGMPSVGVGAALAAGQADELAYQEMVRRERSGTEGGYMGDLAIGTGWEARDETDTLPMRIARGASVPAAGLFGAGGAALGKAAGLGANLGYNLIANPLETGLQAYGQGGDPLDPAMLGTSALIGGLAEGAGRIRPKAKPVTDLAPLPRPQQMGPMEVIAEPLPLPPGNVPRALPDLNVDRPGLSGMPDGMVTLEVGPDGSTYVRDTPPSILPGGNFTEADVARAQQMQELALIKERSARGLPPPFLEQRGLPPADAGLGVRYADDETLNTVQMAREAGLPPVQRYTSGGRPLDGGQAPPDYPDIGVGFENPLPPLSRPGVIPRKAMRGEPIPAPRELPPPVERATEPLPEPIRNNPQPIAEESATPPLPPDIGSIGDPLTYDARLRGASDQELAKASQSRKYGGNVYLRQELSSRYNALPHEEKLRMPFLDWKRSLLADAPPPPMAGAEPAPLPDMPVKTPRKKGGDPPAQQGQEGQEEGVLTPAQVEPTPQAEAPTYTARNLAKGRATEIARESRGSVVPDPDNPKKWAVVPGKQKPQPPKPTGGEPSPLPRPEGASATKTLGEIRLPEGRKSFPIGTVVSDVLEGGSADVSVRVERYNRRGSHIITLKSGSIKQDIPFNLRNPTVQDIADAITDYLSADGDRVVVKDVGARLDRMVAQSAAPRPAPPKRDFKTTGNAEDDKSLSVLRTLKRLTAAQESALKLYEERATADPAKWKEGMGVGWHVIAGGRKTQVNRGFKIVEVDPETKMARVKQVADTGLTVSGGDNDRLKDSWVHVASLVRDKKYDAPQASDPKVYGGPAAILEPFAEGTANAARETAKLARTMFGRPEGIFDSTFDNPTSKDTPVGSEARAKMQRVETDANMTVGKYATPYDAAVTKLNGSDKQYLESGKFFEDYEAGKPMPNPRLQAYADSIRNYADHSGKEAQRLGFKVKRPAGVTPSGQTRYVDVPIQPIKNHLQHRMTTEARDALNSGKGPLHDAIVAEAVKRKIDPDSLLELANQPDLRNRKHGSLNFARLGMPTKVTVDGKPVWIVEKNPLVFFPDFMDRTARELAIAREWGGQGEASKKAIEMAKKIKAETGDEGEQAFTDAFQGMQGLAADSEFARRAAKSLRKISIMDVNAASVASAAENVARAAQLSLSAIPNAISGGVPSAVMAPIGTTIKMAVREGHELASRVVNRLRGLPPNELNKEVQEFRLWRGYSRDLLAHDYTTEDMAGKVGKGSRAFLRGMGVNAANKMWTVHLNYTAKQLLKDYVDLIRKPNDSKLAKFIGESPNQVKFKARRWMGFSEADLDRMAKKGIEDRDFAQAVQRLAAGGNLFNESGLIRPRWMSNPIARRLTSYVSYTRALGNLFADAAWLAKTGDVMPMIKLVTLGTAGAAAGEYVRDWATGKVRDETSALNKLWRWTTQAGFLGLPGFYSNNMAYEMISGEGDIGAALFPTPLYDFYGRPASAAAKQMFPKSEVGKERSMGERVERALPAAGKTMVKQTGIARVADNALGDPLELNTQKKPRELPPPWEDRPRRPRRKREEF